MRPAAAALPLEVASHQLPRHIQNRWLSMTRTTCHESFLSHTHARHWSHLQAMSQFDLGLGMTNLCWVPTTGFGTADSAWVTTLSQMYFNILFPRLSQLHLRKTVNIFYIVLLNTCSFITRHRQRSNCEALLLLLPPFCNCNAYIAPEWGYQISTRFYDGVKVQKLILNIDRG